MHAISRKGPSLRQHPSGRIYARNMQIFHLARRKRRASWWREEGSRGTRRDSASRCARKGRNKRCRTKDLVKRHVRWLAPAETAAGEFARHSAFRMNRQNCVRAAIPNMRSVNAARQTLLRENSQLGSSEILPFAPPRPLPLYA